LVFAVADATSMQVVLYSLGEFVVLFASVGYQIYNIQRMFEGTHVHTRAFHQLSSQTPTNDVHLLSQPFISQAGAVSLSRVHKQACCHDTFLSAFSSLKSPLSLHSAIAL
jgi:hypothetical protein